MLLVRGLPLRVGGRQRDTHKQKRACDNCDTGSGRGSPCTARSLKGRGKLLVRGLPLGVGGRPLRHGQKGACVIACVCVIASLQN